MHELKKNALKKIAVLVSVGRHPISATPRYSRNDAAAFGLAVKLAGPAHSQHTVDVIHAGDPADPGLTDYLALGAGIVNVIATAPGEDIGAALRGCLAAYDLVLCGNRAEHGQESGLLPYLLAAQLGRPIVADVIDLQVEDAVLHAQQFLPKGKRRKVGVKLPAFMIVHPLAPNHLRFSYASLRAGRIVADKHAASMPGTDAETDASVWRGEAAGVKPRKLAAPEKRSGHARMLSATHTEGRGGKLIQNGSATDKAKAVLTYLREHKLVDY